MFGVICRLLLILRSTRRLDSSACSDVCILCYLAISVDFIQGVVFRLAFYLRKLFVQKQSHNKHAIPVTVSRSYSVTNYISMIACPRVLILDVIRFTSLCSAIYIVRLQRAGTVRVRPLHDISCPPGPQQQTRRTLLQLVNGTDRRMDRQTDTVLLSPAPHTMRVVPKKSRTFAHFDNFGLALYSAYVT